MTYMITMADLIKIIGIIFILQCVKSFILGYYLLKQMKEDEKANKDETSA